MRRRKSPNDAKTNEIRMESHVLKLFSAMMAGLFLAAGAARGTCVGDEYVAGEWIFEPVAASLGWDMGEYCKNIQRKRIVGFPFAMPQGGNNGTRRREKVTYSDGGHHQGSDFPWHGNNPHPTIHPLFSKLGGTAQSSPSHTSNDCLQPGETIWVCNAQHVVMTESIEARILADGTVTLPYIGAIRLAGQTISEAERTIQDAYRVSGLYRHLQVLILREPRYQGYQGAGP